DPFLAIEPEVAGGERRRVRGGVRALDLRQAGQPRQRDAEPARACAPMEEALALELLDRQPKQSGEERERIRLWRLHRGQKEQAEGERRRPRRQLQLAEP